MEINRRNKKETNRLTKREGYPLQTLVAGNHEKWPSQSITERGHISEPL